MGTGEEAQAAHDARVTELARRSEASRGPVWVAGQGSFGAEAYNPVRVEAPLRVSAPWPCLFHAVSCRGCNPPGAVLAADIPPFPPRRQWRQS